MRTSKKLKKGWCLYIKYIKSYHEDIVRQKYEVIPGTFDPIFKEIFKSVKEFLADIIYEVTGIPKEEVLKGTIINSEYPILNINEKRRTSDLIIELEDSVINLEMNNHYYKKLNKRNDIYLFKIVSLSDKSVTIQININNFRSKDGSVIKRYTLKDDEGKEEDEIGLIKYDIYLENIKEKYYNNDKLTKLEKYMLMLKLRKREELLEVSKGDKSMSEVYKKLDDLSKDKYYALLYDEEEKKAYENKCILEDAIEDAKENGYSSGYDSGKSEGYSSGLNDGESKKSIEIVKNMLKKNMSIEDISDVTGLTIDEINNLRENI